MFGEIYLVEVIKIQRINCRENTGIPRLGLCSVMFCRCRTFYRLKVCISPAPSKSVTAIFRQPLCPRVSVLHLVILTVFQTFPLLSYLLCGSVISDLRHPNVIVWGATKQAHTRPRNQLIHVVWLLTAPLTGRPPASLPLPRSPCSLRHNNTEIRPINNPTVAPTCSNERKGLSMQQIALLSYFKKSPQGHLGGSVS